MPNTCTVCTNDRTRDIDAALRRGISQRRVAEMFDVGRGSVKRHAENHLDEVPSAPPPHGVYVYSDAEVALDDRVLDEYVTWVAQATGVAADAVRRCFAEVNPPDHHCGACDVPDVTGDLYDALIAARTALERPEPGRWEQRVPA